MVERPLSLIGLTAFVCLFIISGSTTLVPAWIVLFSSIAILIPALILLKRTDKKLFFSSLATISISCLAFSLLFITVSKTEYSSAMNLVSSDTNEIKAKIISNPEISGGRYYYILKLSELNNQPFEGKLRYLSNERLSLEPHSELVINTLEIYPLGKTDSIWHVSRKAQGLYIGAYGEIQSATSPASKNLHYYILKLQNYISNTIMKTIPGQEGALLLGLLLGNTDHINHSNYANSKITGITHLFSVSGLHVSLWSLFVAFLLKKTGLKNRSQKIISMGFLFFIVALTGFTPPALRAGIMLCTLFMGDLILKDADALNSLGLALLIMLIINPFSARNISLILSFSAALGILLFTARIEGFFRAKLKKLPLKHGKKAISMLIPSLAVSFSVIISSLPWMIYFFGAVSIIAPLANLFVILPSSVAMVLTGLALFFSPIKFIFQPLITLAGLVSKYIINITGLLSKISGALINIDNTLLLFSLAAAVFIGLFLFKLGHKKKILQRSYLLFIALLLSTNLIYTLVPTRHININLAELGNNSAIIFSQNNKHGLVACGGTENSLAFALSSQNIHKLDFLLIPRDQETESGAADKIIKDFSPKRMIASSECVGNPNISNKNIDFQNSSNCSMLDNINFAYHNDSDFSAVKLKCNNVDVLICFLPASDFLKMPSHWQTADILICRAALPESLDSSQFRHIFISTDSKRNFNEAENVLTTFEHGNINIKITSHGEIKFK